MSQPVTFAQAEDRLATVLPGYESRPQQQALAARVEALLARTGPVRHLIGQAGCGTGKSLAYLIPAILSGRRVVVSVTTKALQSQLAGKDLPFLQKHLGVEFTWCVLKGRGNYLCSTKLSLAEDGEVPHLRRFVALTNEPAFDGTREALGFDVSDAEWRAVAADSEDCSDAGCKTSTAEDGLVCYAEKARARARECRIVVVNHALFCTDLSLKVRGGGGMLQDYQAVVFDEAHELEEVAAENLGLRVTEGSFLGLAAEVRGWLSRYTDQDDEAAERLANDLIPTLVSAATDLFKALPAGRVRAATVAENEAAFGDLVVGLSAMARTWGAVSSEHIPTAVYKRAKTRRDRIGRRINNLNHALTSVVMDDWTEYCRWVEEERGRNGEPRKALRVALIDVAPYLREHLFSQVPCVLVSATLAVGGRFGYIAGRLGVDEFDGIDVGTPFDFTRQALLYVPTNLSSPASPTAARWEAESAEEILALISASRGRALVLFTSNRHLRSTVDQIRRRIPYTVLVQGEAPVPVLAERFIAETDSVLFGTKSFMTGFDPQGETCSLVVVSKLPFPVPSEPLTEARRDQIRARGGNDFRDYTVPVTSLVLQQAFGRLIRHRGDRGVVAILDSRLETEGYGKQIQRDLPPAPLVGSFAAVEDFFAPAVA